MEWGTVILWIFAVICVIAGLAGLILPALPGQLLIFIGLLLAAWAEDFAYVGAVTLAILAALMILAYILDFIAGAFGAKHFGASRMAALGAVLGAIVGIFFGFIGVLIGPFIGAFVGELMVQSKFESAGRAGIGAWIGLVLGTAAKVALGFSMLGIYLLARFI
jgi:uncharacterized protein YqgC (DUF456 family)